MKLGDNIKSLREARGDRITDLAKRSTLSKQTISGVERDNRSISLDAARLIAAALDQTMDQFVAPLDPPRVEIRYPR